MHNLLDTVHVSFIALIITFMVALLYHVIVSIAILILILQ